MRFNTKLLHGNFRPEEKTGSTTYPIYQSTSFSHKTAEELESIFKGTQYGFIYSRINNPTIESFEKRITAMEKGIGAIACASGMSAISLAAMNLLEQGDELVCSSAIFSGTFSLFQSLNNYGISARFTRDSSPESYAKEITENTRLLFAESIGNPKMDVANIKALANIAHENGIPLVVDNTVTSPYLLRPLELGADIVVHSTSKIINGSGNSLGGIIVDKGRFKWSEDKFPKLYELKKQFGPLAYLAKLRKGLHRDIGASMAPFNAYLNSLGLETLGLRMDRICSNALGLAQFLESHPQVEWVNYPGLTSSPFYELATEQFDGKYGIVLTFGAGSKERAFQIINSLKIASNLANVGDVRTLVIHPASTIYSHNTPEERDLMGVGQDLIRVSVGIEDLPDLIEDFDQALNQLT